jgi:hypothetical protein
LIQDKRVEENLRAAAAIILSADAFERTASTPISLIAAAACDGSNWSVCGSGCEELVAQRQVACGGHATPLFKLYVGCLSAVESFDVISQLGIKAIVNCCWKEHPVNHHAVNGVRSAYVNAVVHVD